MLITTYEHYAGELLGFVEEVCPDSYLDCGNQGALGNLRHQLADWKAVEAFAENKFKAAEYEARYGHLPVKNGVFFGNICPGTNGF